MNLSRPTIDSLKMIVAGKQDPSRFNLLVIGESGLGKTVRHPYFVSYEFDFYFTLQ